MAMGNPLSSLLSNLYMEFFEKRCLPNITYIPVKWYRYVDDILAVLPVGIDVNDLLSKLNNQKVKYETQKIEKTSIKYSVQAKVMKLSLMLILPKLGRYLVHSCIRSSVAGCGRQNPVVRIVGGQPTTVHEYPWQVALTTLLSYKPFCGGSIISYKWVLTAAHCAAGATPLNLYVVIGEHNWATTSETNVTQKIKALFMIVHPQYNSNTLDNDMALIKLASAVTFPADNKIAPVCLPDPGNAYANVNATVTGGTQPQELYEVEVPTMTNTKCQQSHGTNSITANMICAGVDAGGKDSCQGDSGGPLVTEVNAVQTFMVQIGVVSWGNGCALPNYPGVYARVNNYLDWISANIAGSESCPRP
ncbi:trypsin-1-like [Macrobrachium nipponense]|uniref:trypsin-1-like n=1 Tax=Macrobrachium nipponense TaxID=159736 RepID=UPI0030C85C40